MASGDFTYSRLQKDKISLAPQSDAKVSLGSDPTKISSVKDNGDGTYRVTDSQGRVATMTQDQYNHLNATSSSEIQSGILSTPADTKGADSAVATEKQVYDKETGQEVLKGTRNLEDINRAYSATSAGLAYQQTNAQAQISQARRDYAQFTSNETMGLAHNLALNNAQFASKLAQATNGYGMRGLLGSGAMTQATADDTYGANESNNYLRLQSQQSMTDASNKMSDAETKFSNDSQYLAGQQASALSKSQTDFARGSTDLATYQTGRNN